MRIQECRVFSQSFIISLRWQVFLLFHPSLPQSSCRYAVLSGKNTSFTSFMVLFSKMRIGLCLGKVLFLVEPEKLS